MKIIRKRGDTSNILQIFIQDSSSTTGAGLTGLTNLSGSLTAYFHRDVDTTATAIALVSMTVGTFTSSGFKEIDSVNMPGWYQFCPPDTALAATSTPHSVGIALKGATNMMPLNIEIQLVAVDYEDTVRYGLTALPNVASGSAGAIPTTGNGSNQISVSSGQVIIQSGAGTGQLDFTSGIVKSNVSQILGTTVSTPATAGILDVNLKNIANAAVSTSTAQLGVNAVNLGGVAQTGRDIGLSVLLSSGAGTGQLDFTSGVVKSNLAQILGTVLTETSGQLAGGFKKFFNVATPTGTVNSIPDAVAGAAGGIFIAGSNAATTANIAGNITGNLTGSVGSVTSGVTVTTNNDKTGYSLSQTFPTNFSSLAITVGGTVTAGTVSDKTGYSLTQSFPSNFSSLAITGGGAVTAGTVSDKTGYSLTQAFPSNFSSLAITVGGAVTAGTISDKTGYALTSGAYNDAADALLKRDWSSVSGEAARSLLNAGRFIRNKWSITGTTLTVTKEDDTTTAWTATVSTDGSAVPVVGNDPA